MNNQFQVPVFYLIPLTTDLEIVKSYKQNLMSIKLQCCYFFFFFFFFFLFCFVFSLKKTVTLFLSQDIVSHLLAQWLRVSVLSERQGEC